MFCCVSDVTVYLEEVKVTLSDLYKGGSVGWLKQYANLPFTFFLPLFAPVVFEVMFNIQPPFGCNCNP